MGRNRRTVFVMLRNRSKRTQKISLILLAIIILVISTVVAVFIGYRRMANTPELLIASIKEGTNLSIGKIRQTATRDGRKEWSLEANSADYIESEKKVILKDLLVTFFLENGSEVYLEADQGTLQTETNDIEFSGHIVVKNDDYRLQTERLNYQHNPRIIYSDAPVQISSDRAELSADSISYDLKDNKIVLSGKVETNIIEGFAL
jgi:LPS export ABC transporter protein LptC